MTVSLTNDHELIAGLNEQVQNLHNTMHPGIFKPFDRVATTSAIRDFMADAHCRAYIVEDGGVIMGYAIFMIKEIKENAFHYSMRTLYIDQICVLQEHRKSGSGALLMQQAERLAKELSITRLELDHWSANTVAAAFFRKNGYTICKERLCKLIE